MASLTILEKNISLGGNAIKSGLHGSKSKKICFSWYFLAQGCIRLYRTPKDPKFVKVGVVMVNYENQWEKMENNDFFLLNGSVWCIWSLSTLL